MNWIKCFLRNFKDSFNTAFPRKWWLLSLVLFIAAIAPILFLPNNFSSNIEQESIRYMLSAQAQTLGTILALVFTLTLVGAQLATRYSHLLLYRVLAPWAFWYAIPYATGTILPLILLSGTYPFWVARLSILLGGVCIVLLAPFFVSVRNLLSMVSVVSDLKKQIIGAESEEHAVVMIQSLGTITIGALNLRDYETFDLGAKYLRESGQESKTCERVLLVARHLGRLIAQTGDDRLATEALLRELRKLTMESLEQYGSGADERFIANYADVYEGLTPVLIGNLNAEVREIKEVGCRYASKREYGSTVQCQRFLHRVGRITISRAKVNDELPNLVMAAIGDIAKASITASDECDASIKAAVSELEDLGRTAAERGLRDLHNRAVLHLDTFADRLRPVRNDLAKITEATKTSLRESIGE